MKTIAITIDEDVHFSCLKLIEERTLSSTVNELLRSFTNLQDNDFFAEKKELEIEKVDLSKRLSEVISKLTIMGRKEKDSRKKAKQQTLQALEGLRRNNPLRDVI